MRQIYRGRIAPSPTGFLHFGHAMTFWRAQERAREAGGRLVLRIEDLDSDRCRREFADAIINDLHWFGLDWNEGPDIGGPCVPYVQSQRRSRYLVVRGKDLLVSTFRQLLLYHALNLTPPKFFHTQLIVDESGKRLAKRHGALSLRALRERGFAAEELRACYMGKS